MNIAFLRESEGVYQFGSKRVYVKVEKGDRVFVRVGGGFMYIEDFIATYSQEETDKIQRKDAFTKFRNKLSVQTIAANVSSNARETSPVRSPVRARSPERY